MSTLYTAQTKYIGTNAMLQYIKHCKTLASVPYEATHTHTPLHVHVCTRKEALIHIQMFKAFFAGISKLVSAAQTVKRSHTMH